MMKIVILAVMFAAVAALIAYAGSRGQDVVIQGFRSSSTSFLEVLPILVVAFLVMGFVEALVPRELIERWLSEDSGWRGLGLAWLAGALTPGGSLVGMPMAAGLVRAGAGTSVVVTYLCSLALLSVMRLPLELSMLGWRLTLVRVAASLALPLLAGLTTKLVAPWLTLGATT